MSSKSSGTEIVQSNSWICNMNNQQASYKNWKTSHHAKILTYEAMVHQVVAWYQLNWLDPKPHQVVGMG